jgi:hypothetical protein
MRVPEWNSLCWLVERKRERKGGKLRFGREQELSKMLKASFVYQEVSDAGPSDLACPKGFQQRFP